MSGCDIKILVSDQRFPEGPAFDRDGQLWWSEIEAGKIKCLTVDGEIRQFPVGGKPNGLAIGEENAIYFCDGERGEIGRLDTLRGIRTVIASGHEAPNDLAFDAMGNLVFTCPGNSRQSPTGYVACISPDGNSNLVGEGVYFPNGLAFSADGLTLILAETYRGRLLSGRWSAEERRWSDPVPICSTSQSANGPDGIALGTDGSIFVAIYGGGCVDVFDCNGARTDRLVIPGANPTNCAFDPTGRLGLVITEAENGQILSTARHLRGQILFDPSDMASALC